MVDHSRIRSGFDLELQLSSDFFFQALMAMVESGDLPNEVPAGSGGGTIVIGPPVEVRISSPPNDTPEEELWDLEVDFDTDFLTGLRITVRIALDTTLKHNHDIYKNLVTGVSLGIRYVGTEPPLPDDYDAKLRRHIDRTLPNILPGVFQSVEKRTLAASDNCRSCIAFLINMYIKVGPLNEVEHINGIPVSRTLPPERSINPIPRGNAANAVPFLNQDEDIGVGCPQEIYSRLAHDIMHSFYDKNAPGINKRPVKDGASTIGYFNSVSVKPFFSQFNPATNGMTVRTDLTITESLNIGPVTIDDNVHIDAKQVTKLTLNTNDEDEVTLDIDVGKPEADTDFWEGLLGIGLIILGATIAWLSLGSGLLIGGYIGGLVSAAPLYTLRSIVAEYERKGKKRAEKEINEQSGITSLLTSIPSRVDIIEHRDSPFHNHFYQVRTRFTSIRFDQEGISLAGTVETSEDDRAIHDIYLSSRARDDEPNGNLTFLEVDVPDHEDIRHPENFRRLEPEHYPSVFAITPEDAKRLSREQLIELLRLKVTGQRPSGSRIAELLFDDGAALKPAEAAHLQDKGVLRVYGVQLVKPRGKSPYYRTDPDLRRDNNLHNKPVFRSFRAARVAQRIEDLLLRLKRICIRTEDSTWFASSNPGGGLTIPALAYHTLSGLVLLTHWIEKIGEGTPPNPTLEQRNLAKMFETDTPERFQKSESANRISTILPGLTAGIMQLNDHAMNKYSHGILDVPNIKNYEFAQTQLDWFESRLDDLSRKIHRVENP